MDLFKRPKASGRAGSVKAWVIEGLGLDEDDVVTVAELACHEPDCPPIETLISVHNVDGSRRDWRTHKPLADITETDVQKILSAGSTLHK